MVTLDSRRLRNGTLEALGVLALAAILALTVGLIRGSQPAARSEAAMQTADTRTIGQRAVDQAQRRLSAAPDSPRAMAALASAYLVRARENADPTLFQRAEALLTTASEANPDEPEVVLVAGTLALTRHDFAEALELGRRAVELSRYRPAAHGVLVDALVELGRYDEAVVAAQQMVDLRPDLSSLSRVSYLRELHGDLDGAVVAMGQAVAAGAPRGEATAWSEVQLGNLQFAQGDLAQADEAYRQAGKRIDGYAPALAGMGRVLAASGDLVGATAHYEAALQATPLAEYAIALGDIYTKLGHADRAEAQYAVADAIGRLFVASGVRMDVELAIFHADRIGNLDEALAAAQAEYALRPSVTAADALAWVEYRAGYLDDALLHSHEAVRLGTRDPLMLYHAGVIAQANGDDDAARRLLGDSASLNPRFSLLWADDLAARLALLTHRGGDA
jgi:tetratricopeptide (TPR) repeat protein